MRRSTFFVESNYKTALLMQLRALTVSTLAVMPAAAVVGIGSKIVDNVARMVAAVPELVSTLTSKELNTLLSNVSNSKQTVGRRREKIWTCTPL